jgi:hypothetical protein
MTHPDQQYQCKRVEVGEVFRPSFSNVMPETQIAGAVVFLDPNVDGQQRNRNAEDAVAEGLESR